MKPSGQRLAFDVLTEIGIIEQLARNQLERRLPDGLKMAQFTVLNHFVRLGGEWSPARLAAAFQVTKGAMTNTLQRLEARGLVHIRPDDSDGRMKLVSITPAGREMHKRCKQSVVPQLDDVLAAVSAGDLAGALPVLKKLRAHLDAHRL